jgi:hypothetical protein
MPTSTSTSGSSADAGKRTPRRSGPFASNPRQDRQLLDLAMLAELAAAITSPGDPLVTVHHQPRRIELKPDPADNGRMVTEQGSSWGIVVVAAAPTSHTSPALVARPSGRPKPSQRAASPALASSPRRSGVACTDHVGRQWGLRPPRLAARKWAVDRTLSPGATFGTLSRFRVTVSGTRRQY